MILTSTKKDLLKMMTTSRESALKLSKSSRSSTAKQFQIGFSEGIQRCIDILDIWIDTQPIPAPVIKFLMTMDKRPSDYLTASDWELLRKAMDSITKSSKTKKEVHRGSKKNVSKKA